MKPFTPQERLAVNPAALATNLTQRLAAGRGLLSLSQTYNTSQQKCWVNLQQSEAILLEDTDQYKGSSSIIIISQLS